MGRGLHGSGAPAAAGGAALIEQRFPGIPVGALKTKLMNSADDEGKKGNDPFYGKGFVNARRAVTEQGRTHTVARESEGRKLPAPDSLATGGLNFLDWNRKLT